MATLTVKDNFDVAECTQTDGMVSVLPPSGYPKLLSTPVFSRSIRTLEVCFGFGDRSLTQISEGNVGDTFEYVLSLKYR